MLRIVICILILVGFMALLIHFGLAAGAGSGAGMLGVAATACALCGFVAVAWRTRVWLRAVFVVVALGLCALLVDQVVYRHWHGRLERFVTGIRSDVEAGAPDLSAEMGLRPASLRIEPGQVFHLTFEPPPLAWTYHVESTSAPGRALMGRWHGLLAGLLKGTEIDPVAATIIGPHEAYSITVASSAGVLACLEDGDQGWMVSVEAAPGGRSL